MIDDEKFSFRIRYIIPVLLGLAVPAMVSGRAVLQGLAAAALITALFLGFLDRTLFIRWATALRTRLALAVLLAFAGMAVSIPGSLDSLRSFDAWGRTLAYIGGSVLFWAYLVEDPRAKRLCQRAFIAASLIGLTAVFIGQLGWELPYRILRNDFIPWNSNWSSQSAKAYAAAAACCVPVSLWIARQETRRWQAVSILVALGQAVLVVTTINKSALAGLLVMILICALAIAMRKGLRFIAAWALGAIAATAVILLLVYELPDEPASRPVWDWLPAQLVDTHRQQIWHFTAGKIAENPWTGYGINVIDRIPGAHDILPGYDAETIPSHPHNWILEILGETGVIGLIPVLVAIGWLAACSFCRFLTRADEAQLAQLAVTAVFWGSSLFNFSIWSSWWLITYFLLIAITAAGSSHRSSEPAQPNAAH